MILGGSGVVLSGCRRFSMVLGWFQIPNCVVALKAWYTQFIVSR